MAHGHLLLSIALQLTYLLLLHNQLVEALVIDYSLIRGILLPSSLLLRLAMLIVHGLLIWILDGVLGHEAALCAEDLAAG